MLPPVRVWLNILYHELWCMPAISKVMVLDAWQEAQRVTVPLLALLSVKLTRILLPTAQRGALNKATSGLAVATTTGFVPVTKGFT